MKKRSLLLYCLGLVTMATVFPGCESPVPIPMPPLPGMNKKHTATWKNQNFAIRQNRPTEIRVKSKQDLFGVVTLDESLYDGYVFGNLTFKDHDGNRIRIEKCWRGTLVDATEIRWPNGESWVLFVWDHGKEECYRTLTVFYPRSRELFSLEMNFLKDEKKDFSGVIKCRFSWKLKLPDFKKFLDFLEKIKVSYAAPKTWGQEVRGTRYRGVRRQASATFDPSRDYLLEELLPEANKP